MEFLSYLKVGFKVLKWDDLGITGEDVKSGKIPPYHEFSGNIEKLLEKRVKEYILDKKPAGLKPDVLREKFFHSGEYNDFRNDLIDMYKELALVSSKKTHLAPAKDKLEGDADNIQKMVDAINAAKKTFVDGISKLRGRESVDVAKVKKDYEHLMGLISDSEKFIGRAEESGVLKEISKRASGGTDSKDKMVREKYEDILKGTGKRFKRYIDELKEVDFSGKPGFSALNKIVDLVERMVEEVSIIDTIMENEEAIAKKHNIPGIVGIIEGVRKSIKSAEGAIDLKELKANKVSMDDLKKFLSIYRDIFGGMHDLLKKRESERQPYHPSVLTDFIDKHESETTRLEELLKGVKGIKEEDVTEEHVDKGKLSEIRKNVEQLRDQHIKDLEEFKKYMTTDQKEYLKDKIERVKEMPLNTPSDIRKFLTQGIDDAKDRTLVHILDKLHHTEFKVLTRGPTQKVEIFKTDIKGRLPKIWAVLEKGEPGAEYIDALRALSHLLIEESSKMDRIVDKLDHFKTELKNKHKQLEKTEDVKEVTRPYMDPLLEKTLNPGIWRKVLRIPETVTEKKVTPVKTEYSYDTDRLMSLLRTIGDPRASHPEQKKVVRNEIFKDMPRVHEVLPMEERAERVKEADEREAFKYKEEIGTYVTRMKQAIQRILKAREESLKDLNIRAQDTRDMTGSRDTIVDFVSKMLGRNTLVAPDREKTDYAKKIFTALAEKYPKDQYLKLVKYDIDTGYFDVDDKDLEPAMKADRDKIRHVYDYLEKVKKLNQERGEEEKHNPQKNMEELVSYLEKIKERIAGAISGGGKMDSARVLLDDYNTSAWQKGKIGAFDSSSKRDTAEKSLCSLIEAIASNDVWQGGDIDKFTEYLKQGDNFENLINRLIASSGKAYRDMASYVNGLKGHLKDIASGGIIDVEKFYSKKAYDAHQIAAFVRDVAYSMITGADPEPPQLPAETEKFIAEWPTHKKLTAPLAERSHKPGGKYWVQFFQQSFPIEKFLEDWYKKSGGTLNPDKLDEILSDNDIMKNLEHSLKSEHGTFGAKNLEKEKEGLEEAIKNLKKNIVQMDTFIDTIYKSADGVLEKYNDALSKAKPSEKAAEEEIRRLKKELQDSVKRLKEVLVVKTHPGMKKSLLNQINLIRKDIRIVTDNIDTIQDPFTGSLKSSDQVSREMTEFMDEFEGDIIKSFNQIEHNQNMLEKMENALVDTNNWLKGYKEGKPPAKEIEISKKMFIPYLWEVLDFDWMGRGKTPEFQRQYNIDMADYFKLYKKFKGMVGGSLSSRVVHRIIKELKKYLKELKDYKWKTKDITSDGERKRIKEILSKVIDTQVRGLSVKDSEALDILDQIIATAKDEGLFGDTPGAEEKSKAEPEKKSEPEKAAEPAGKKTAGIVPEIKGTKELSFRVASAFVGVDLSSFESVDPARVLL